MKIANMNLHYHRYSLKYFLDSTTRLGLRAIELWGGTPHLYVDDVNYQEISSILKEIKKRELELICFTPEQCAYPINLSAEDETFRKRSINYFKRCIQIANSLECSNLLVTAGYGLYNEPIEEAWRKGRESLQILAGEAEKAGITLLLEPLSRFGSNLVYNLNTLKQMYQEVNSPNLKVMLDTIPMRLSGDSIDEYGAEFGEDLKHIHLLDGDGQTTAHLAWGEGNFSLDSFMDMIQNIQYNNYFTLELIGPKYNWDPEEATRKSLIHINNSLKSNPKV